MSEKKNCWDSHPAWNNHNVIIIYDTTTQRRRKPMTICLAICCDCNIKDKSPKLIMVADRMITIQGLEIEFEHPQTKLTQVTKNCVMASAGNSLAITELVDVVRQKLRMTKHTPQIRDVASLFKDTYIELRRKEIEDHILKPVGIASLDLFYQSQQNRDPGITMEIFKRIKKFNYELTILIGGVDNSGAHIYGIDDPGVVYNLNDLGYDAIGSGDTHALLTFIGANYHTSTPFEEALYLIYKAKKLSEKAPGIGTKYTDIWVIEKDAVYEIKQGDEKNKEGIRILQEMYEEELKQSTVPFNQLAEIAKTQIKKDTDIDKSYS